MNKNEFMHIQYLYDHTVTNEVLNYLEKFNSTAAESADSGYNVAGTSPICRSIRCRNQSSNNQSSNRKDYVTIDRSFYSTLAYDIIFKYNGHIDDAETFKSVVDSKVFSDTMYKDLLTRVWCQWSERFSKFFPNLDISLLWIIPKNVDVCVENLIKRSSFETKSNFNLKHYVENQSYVFEMLHKITNVGELVYVDAYVTEQTLLNHIRHVQ